MIILKITMCTGFTHIVEVLPNLFNGYIKFLKTLNSVEKYEVILTVGKGTKKQLTSVEK